MSQTVIDRDRTYRPDFLARFFPSARWALILDPHNSNSFQVVGSSGRVEHHCLDIESISTAKGLLWHRIEFKSGEKTHTLPGLSRSGTEKLAGELYAFINSHLFALIDHERDALNDITDRLGGNSEGQERYIAHSDLSRAIAQAPADVAIALQHPLFDPQLMPSHFKTSLPAWLEMLVRPDLRHSYNDAVVVSEMQRFDTFFSDLDGRSLSDQQREACVRQEDNNLLVAAAGSGKSATLVGKVAYVLEKKLYRPNEILLLAFNKSAADELRSRIARQLQVDENTVECRVTTFHALGRSIIEHVEGRPPLLANWAAHPAGETKMLDEIIQGLVKADPEFMRLWMDLLVVHPKADMPAEFFDTDADYQRYISDRQRKGQATISSLAGVIVKSLQEQKIANWLWLRSVSFEYERQLEVEDEDGLPRHLHPDFYYPESGTVHEHFALNADGTSPFADYAEHAERKRQAYLQHPIDFFETTSAQASGETLFETLEAELKQRGITFKPKSYSDITDALERVVIKHYHSLILTCIKHIRANHLSLDMLLERAKTLHDKERAQVFARVVSMIAQDYSQRLDDSGQIDFDSMIVDATKLVEAGRFESPFSLILVDEFQDISEPQAKLIKALKQQKTFCKLFAVGDDWQSIYRFAGSDISIFTQFTEYFGQSWQGRLEQTYRCNQLIADTAAQFVQRNPEQIKKSVRSTRAAIPRSIRVVPVDEKRNGSDIAQASHSLLKRLDAALGSIAEQWRDEANAKLKVLVLWRYNLLDPFEGKPPSFANIEVAAMSFHRAKGLEADYVVLLDVSEGDYGVPSRIEDDELLHLVMPRPESFVYAEERRLFYVALTRAIRGAYLITNNRQPSRYIRELCEIAGDQVAFETVDGNVLDQQCPSCLVGQLVERRAKTGRAFRGCNQFPDCKHSESIGRGEAI